MERNLDINGQRSGFKKNVIEEINEYNEASNEHDTVDAICDICVFTLNAMKESSIEQIKLQKVKSSTTFSEQLDKITASAFDEKELIYMVEMCYTLATEMGYSFKECMEETIRELNSRRGAWSEEKRKWIKDPNVVPYRANYSQFKINKCSCGMC
jgi:hypothetical protein